MKKISFMVLLLSVTSCMMNPEDGDYIAHRVPTRFFDGYIPHPGETVEVQVYDTTSGVWRTFAEATSSTTPEVYITGTWYYWQVDAHIPRQARYWPLASSGDATIRALNRGSSVYTGTAAMWDCVFDEILGGQLDPITAYQNCAAQPGLSAETTATLLGDCTVIQNSGCFDLANETTLTNWPDEEPVSQMGAMVDTLQGITHDDNYWYFSSTGGGTSGVGGYSYGSLARASKGANLALSSSYTMVPNPFEPGSTHPGGMDYHDGWLYVALQTQNGTNPVQAVGAVPTATFTDKSTYRTLLLTAGPHSFANGIPWIARDPQSGYFFSSIFDSNKLIRYSLVTDAQQRPTGLVYCGEVTMSETVERIQGGVFSDSGRLYLSTDPKFQPEIDAGSIKVVEMGGHSLAFEPINCASPPSASSILVDVVDSIFIDQYVDDPNFGGGGEMQDVTIWDVDDGSTHGGVNRGQLHTIMVDKNLFDDTASITHHRFDPEEL